MLKIFLAKNKNAVKPNLKHNKYNYPFGITYEPQTNIPYKYVNCKIYTIEQK